MTTSFNTIAVVLSPDVKVLENSSKQPLYTDEELRVLLQKLRGMPGIMSAIVHRIGIAMCLLLISPFRHVNLGNASTPADPVSSTTTETSSSSKRGNGSKTLRLCPCYHLTPDVDWALKSRRPCGAEPRSNEASKQRRRQRASQGALYTRTNLLGEPRARTHSTPCGSSMMKVDESRQRQGPSKARGTYPSIVHYEKRESSLISCYP